MVCFSVFCVLVRIFILLKAGILGEYSGPNFQGPLPYNAEEKPAPLQMSPELGMIFNELSWSSRQQLLDKYYPTNKTVISGDSLMQPYKPKGVNSTKRPLLKKTRRPKPPSTTVRWTLHDTQGSQGPYGTGDVFRPEETSEPGIEILYPEDLGPRDPDNPMWPNTPDRRGQGPMQGPKLPDTRRAGRGIGISALKMPRIYNPARRQGPPVKPPSPSSRDDETSMKLKLFRLMYETVRDSDLKVKRAELIKTQYVNSSAFEVGYLLGDISDKYNIMSDIALTLQRLYSEWRPIEHINAYEQIANQAIEISHLIDLAKTVHKRNEGSRMRRQ